MTNLLLSKSRVLVAVSVIVAVGCGGKYHGGNGTSQPVSETNIVVTPGTGYNGSNSPLTGTPTVQGVNTGVTIVLVEGDRELDVTLPVASIVAGNTIAAGSTGAYFDYSEGGQASFKSWSATSGGITITRVQNGKLDATVNNLGFVPTVDADSASGTFTASGTVANVPIPG